MHHTPYSRPQKRIPCHPYRARIVSLLHTALILCILNAMHAIVLTPETYGNERETAKQVEWPFDATERTQVTLTYIGPKEKWSKYNGMPSDSITGDDKVAFRQLRKIVEKIYKGKINDMSIGWYDLNHDGILDIFVMNRKFSECGAPGNCPFYLLVSQKNGQWKEMFQATLFVPPTILSSKHLGYNDLSDTYAVSSNNSFSDAIYRFDGVEYSFAYRMDNESSGNVDITSTWMFPYVFTHLRESTGKKRLLDLK